MTSTSLFLIITIISIIVLLVSSITAAISANDAYNSGLYGKNSQVTDAHKYLVISSILGFSSLATLIVILITAYVAGDFTYKDISKKNNFSFTRGLIIAILIIVCIITFIVGILSAIAASDLSKVPRTDQINSAYMNSVVSSVFGIAGIAFVVIGLVTYILVSSKTNKKIKTTST